MRKLFFALSTAGMCLFPLAAFGQEDQRNQTTVSYSHIVSSVSEAREVKRYDLDVCQQYYTRNFPGFFSCLNVVNNGRLRYGEAYMGPTLGVGWIRAGAGAGIDVKEGEKIHERFAGFVRADHGIFSLYALGEGGRNAPRYRLEVDGKITEHLFAGMVYERRHGVGPRVEWFVPEYLTYIWVAPLYNPDQKKVEYVAGFHGIL